VSAALCIGLLWAQGEAVLTGRILDPSGRAVPSAALQVTDLSTATVRRMQTDEEGAFYIPQLRAGQYEVRVQAPGFKTLVRESVQVLVATANTLTLTLEIGTTAESVTVSDETGTGVNATDATIGDAFAEEQVRSLPFLARNPVNLLTLQPGVIFTGDSDTDLLFLGSPGRNIDDREGVVNGVRANQGNLTLDGVDVNDWETQATFTSALPVTLDSMQEFRVVTSNANANRGFGSGAQISLVTRSGSNEVHGNLRWYHRNTATAANTFFNNSAGVPTPKLIRNIGGVSVGGPLRRNRLFLFGDYELRRDSSESTQLRVVPTETFKRGLLGYQTTGGQTQFLGPATFRALDPAGIGVNPAVLRYLAQFPTANDQTQGDGINAAGYRFNAPIRTDNNLYTAKLDWNITADGRHTAFIRGSLGDIGADLRPQQFPGQQVASRLLNNSKGLVAAHTWQLSPAAANTVRYGFTRQGIEETGTRTARFTLTGTTGGSISDLYPVFRGSGRRVPIHYISDDFTWTAGSHAIQLGGALRFVRNSRFTESNSYPGLSTQQVMCAGTCRDIFTALTGDADSGNDPADANRFTDSVMGLTGAITAGSATFLVDPTAERLLPTGTPQARRFAENAYEFYLQDSWRVRPNLTLTAGVRYSYYTPIWETNGFMVRPNFDVEDWWNRRQSDMYAGRPSDATPPLAWDLAGRANGQPALYNPDKNNFAPRVAIAWAPQFDSGIGRELFGAPGKTAIRAGWGMYHHRIGSSLAVTADRDGSPGLTTSLSSTVGQFGLANAPRFAGACDSTGCTGLPEITQFVRAPASVSFPFFPERNGNTLGFLVDNRLETPYNMSMNFSVQRELSASLVVEATYVGTLGRKLPLRADFAQFSGYLTDPASGQSFWDAQGRVADLIGPDPFRPAINPNDRDAVSRIAPIPFFENLMSNLPAFIRSPGLSPTQAFYMYAAARAPGWATMMPGLDARLTPGSSPWSTSIDPQQDGWVLFHPQKRWMPTLTNYGVSHYHSAQFSIRRNVGSALFGFNYVLSKAIDNASASENGQENGGAVGGRSVGQVTNPFRIGSDRAVSDFDVRHNLSGHWLWDLPFGKDRRFAAISGWLDTIVGGWNFNGVWRWHSGLPISLHNGVPRSTNEVRSYSATLIAPIERDVTKTDPFGYPNLFADPLQARAALAYTRPGGSGNRNPVYGPRYSNFDIGVYKNFRLPMETHRIQFRAVAFNAFNTANFFAEQYSHTASFFSTPERFGRLTETVGSRGGAREFEFALRYEF
jgi:hypothetical protein